jgi:hypothetical protein
MSRRVRRLLRRRWLVSFLAVVTAAAGLSVARISIAASAAAGSSTPVIDLDGSTLSHRKTGATGGLGVTFGFEDRTLAGGPYDNQGNQIYNDPLYEANTGPTASFWDNYVEELVSAGVDFVAVDTRGYVPGSSVPNGGGDPRELSQLVDAINRAGAADKLKVAAFDDTPASMTDKKNQIKHHTGGYTPTFDMGDTTGAGEGGYQYLWDNDLKAFFQAVPDNLLYKVDGQPLVYLWSDNSFAFTNQGNGNSAKMLQYVRSQAESTFGESPYFVLDQSWLQNDPSTASVANGADDWFGVPSPTYTNRSFNGSSYGVTVPSFHFVAGTTNMVIDPNHGQTLVNNLEATVDAGDKLTLVEGFSDWPEGAGLWRTVNAPYGTTQRDYPNQDLGILRRYSRTPFPTDMTVQAESADAVHDTTPGNTWNLYRGDDLDVQATTDIGGGWNVGQVDAGEWERWNEVPMQGTQDIQVRVATPTAGAQFRFVIDGVAGPVINVPDTGGWQTWQTVDAGTFQFNPGTYHTVRIEQLTGGQNINWWKAASTSTGKPQVISLRAHANGMIVTAENGGALPLIANGTAIGPSEQFDEIDLGNGNIALHAHANNMIVTAENAGALPLIANRTAAGPWETFQLIHNPDGSISLKAQADNDYVTAEDAGNQSLIANRTAIGPWEEFDLIND